MFWMVILRRCLLTYKHNFIEYLPWNSLFFQNKTMNILNVTDAQIEFLEEPPKSTLQTLAPNCTVSSYMRSEAISLKFQCNPQAPAF